MQKNRRHLPAWLCRTKAYVQKFDFNSDYYHYAQFDHIVGWEMIVGIYTSAWDSVSSLSFRRRKDFQDGRIKPTILIVPNFVLDFFYAYGSVSHDAPCSLFRTEAKI